MSVTSRKKNWGMIQKSFSVTHFFKQLKSTCTSVSSSRVTPLAPVGAFFIKVTLARDDNGCKKILWTKFTSMTSLSLATTTMKATATDTDLGRSNFLWEILHISQMHASNKYAWRVFFCCKKSSYRSTYLK